MTNVDKIYDWTAISLPLVKHTQKISTCHDYPIHALVGCLEPVTLCRYHNMVNWRHHFPSEWCTCYTRFERIKNAFFRNLYEVLHFLLQISMFCALSQNYYHLFWKVICASYRKLSKELKNSIKILARQAVLELLIQTTFWLFDS